MDMDHQSSLEASSHQDHIQTFKGLIFSIIIYKFKFFPEHKRFIKINAGSISRSTKYFLSNIFKHSPSLDHLILDIHTDMISFIQTFRCKYNFKWLLLFLKLQIEINLDYIVHCLKTYNGICPNHHHDISIARAKLRAREL